MKTTPGRRGRFRRSTPVEVEVVPASTTPPESQQQPSVDIAPNDPLIAYLQNAAGAVDVEALELDSPGLRVMKAAGVSLAIPLVSQGELIGVLNLGPRLSEQMYSTDDRKLLENLASQAAPALRVAQLVREQEVEIRMRERYEQELQIAHLIQQNFLPRQAPEVAGWQLDAFYRSAREVGGDFYDFIELPDGKVGIVIGDVTDKGVPAALVMASTRSVIRGAAKRGLSPGAVLERVNELVTPEMPEKMFVTCLYAVLEPATGLLRFANAGHNLPYQRASDCVNELRARGMPLGLLPGMNYEEHEVVLEPGETVLFSSDGIAEAHGPDGEMFGCPKLVEIIGEHPGGIEIMDTILTELHRFTGPGWEQEDDITMVVLQRTSHREGTMAAFDRSDGSVVDEFSVPSEPGNERQVMERVAGAVADRGLAPDRLEKLKTAVAEATMNAIEHGNENRAELPVLIRILADGDGIRVTVTDHGGGKEVSEAAMPDLEAKLAGEQSPRGWGLFLIKNMVDEMHVETDDTHHTVELVMKLKGERR